MELPTGSPEHAEHLIDEGLQFMDKNELDLAEKYFIASLKEFPLPKAYTYLGWVLSDKGQIQEAIDCCHQAILLDPDYGIAYDDMGLYLLELNEPYEAIPWFEKAKQIPHFKLRHLPYIHLGQLYMKIGNLEKARQEYEEALKIDPHHVEARYIINHLDKTKSLTDYIPLSKTTASTPTEKSDNYVSIFSLN